MKNKYPIAATHRSVSEGDSIGIFCLSVWFKDKLPPGIQWRDARSNLWVVQKSNRDGSFVLAVSRCFVGHRLKIVHGAFIVTGFRKKLAG